MDRAVPTAEDVASILVQEGAGVPESGPVGQRGGGLARDKVNKMPSVNSE